MNAVPIQTQSERTEPSGVSWKRDVTTCGVDQREHLYAHDVGLSRLRKTMQVLAQKQLVAQ